MNNDLGRYLLTEKLGEGGMAAVYMGLDRHLNRTVAVKVILPGFQQSALFIKRFEREAQALAQLAHPNLVSVIDYGSHGGTPYLVMEYVPGGSLKERLGQPIPWQQAARQLLPIAHALQYAHSQGIIHRDIKPANILITATDDMVLSDFGIAKTIGIQEATQLTGTGVSMGTPAYMAPEQSLGNHVDHRADIYALGIVFYEMLTGRAPYEADTPMAVMLKHVTEPLPDPRQFVADLPEMMETIVFKTLAKDPANRYPTMGQFADALEHLVQMAYHGQTDASHIGLGTLINEAAQMAIPGGPAEIPPHASHLPVRRSHWPWVLGGVVLLCMLLAGVSGVSGMAYHFFAAGSPAAKEQANHAAGIAVDTLTPLPASETTQPIQVALVASATPVAASPTKPPTPTTAPRPPSATPRPSPTPTFTLPPTATPLGGGGLIAFHSDRTGNNDIYVMQPDGSALTQLTFGPADERAPAWSPDGHQIAYQSNDGGDYEIYVVALADGQTRAITRNECNDHSPVWSPDGKQFVYYADCDGNREIYVMDVNGGNIRQLTRTDDTYNWFPSWSPNGRQITFSSNRSGAYQVYVMNTDGSGLQALADGCVPFFSPDGRQIVFNQYCMDSGNIWLVNADGSNARSITAAPFDNNRNPNWSADGTKIVFQSEQSGNFELWLMDADGSNRQQLTDTIAIDAAPAWQPGKIR